MSGWLLLDAEVPDVLERQLAHGRRRWSRVDSGDPHLVSQILAVIDRRHEELDRRPSEPELVQPVTAERMGVVEREALRLDVAVAGAERRARISVRQCRRLQPVRLLVAVAREEPVVRRQVVVDLEVELVVLPLLHRVDQVVVDLLPARTARAGGIRRGIQLVEDVRRGRIPAVGRDDVALKWLAGDRIVNDAASAPRNSPGASAPTGRSTGTSGPVLRGAPGSRRRRKSCP